MKGLKGRIEMEVRVLVDGRELEESEIDLQVWHQIYSVGRSRLLKQKRLNSATDTLQSRMNRVRAAGYLGVPIATLKRYEEVGLLPRAAVEKGKVLYNLSAVRRLGMGPINLAAQSATAEDQESHP